MEVPTLSRSRALALRFPALSRRLYESRFWRGYRRFKKTGETGEAAFRSLRILHALSDGKFNRAVSAKIAKERGRSTFAPLEHAIAWNIASEVGAALAGLRQDGCYVFEERLPEAYCEELTRFAETTPGRLVDDRPGPGLPECLVFDAEAPKAPRYNLPEAELLQVEAVQELLADASLLGIAQDFLGCAPINDLVAMWWSTRHGDEPCHSGAQLFHSDMDRIGFLKFFVYLTDVTPETGPHVYIKGTHRTQPRNVRQDRRILDEEVECLGDAQVEITGPRGTVITADTSGLHKGKIVGEGTRLVFQIEFTNSLFGADYVAPELSRVHPSLAQRLRENPECYERISPAACNIGVVDDCCRENARVTCP
ncbi:MAG: phytanoyl-CoA dioxygenase family protein [Planctomycetota bacterium]